MLSSFFFYWRVVSALTLSFSFENFQNTINQLTAQNAELQEMLRNVENVGSMEPSGTESMLELLTNCSLIFCTEF